MYVPQWTVKLFAEVPFYSDRCSPKRCLPTKNACQWRSLWAEKHRRQSWHHRHH